ncbi:MAG: translocation/assembly module TamB domain-containing protein [Oligoflexia bacterium]|nr:translocation/assembly module TamB domain-containing protein [Oligoflexia bacterium]
MKLFFKCLGWVGVSSVGLAVGGALLVLQFPQLLVNDRSFSLAIKKFVPSSYPITWSRERIDVRSMSFLKKEFSFRFDRFCVLDQADQAFSACFDRVSLRFVVDFSRLIPRLSVIGPIEITGGDIALNLDRLPSRPSAGPGKAFEMPRLAKTVLAGARIEEILLDLPRLRVQAGGKTAEGGLRIEKQPLKPWGLDGSASAQFEEGARADLTAHFIQEGSRASFQLDANYRQGAKKIAAHANGSVGRAGLQARFSGWASKLDPQLTRVDVNDCALSVKPVENGADYRLHCPMRASLPLPPPSLKVFGIPRQLGLVVSGEIHSPSLLPSMDRPLDGNLLVSIDPIISSLFTGGGHLGLRLNGKPAEFSKGKGAEAETDLFLKIPRFERIVTRLRGTSWDIPAPLRVLKGSFEVQAKGKTDLRQGVFPARLDTKLSSRSQALKIDASSVFEFHRAGGFNSGLDAEITLSDVQVELPRLDLAVPPRLMPDERIQAHHPVEAKKAEPSSFVYQVKIKTQEGHPLRVVSNLAKAPVPIDLDLTLDRTGNLSGPIRIERFPVVLFRQKATIDHFVLTLKEPRDASDVDGLIKIPHGDYTILIDVVGTISEPRVRVESEPPVPTNQLVSVLLYGDQQENLDSNQRASVGNTEAAFSQGAMGLASLYLFASTPVQSLLYDPTTRSVTARISLGGGTTLNLSGNGSQFQSVGLRKRLGPSWAVTTSVDQSKENPGAQIVTAFLEWIHRY